MRMIKYHNTDAYVLDKGVKHNIACNHKSYTASHNYQLFFCFFIQISFFISLITPSLNVNIDIITFYTVKRQHFYFKWL